MGPDGHGVAILSERDGVVPQERLLVGLLPPANLAPHIYDDFAGPVGAHVDGAEVHLDHDRAARLDGEALVELFLSRGRGSDRAEEEEG